MRLLGGIRTVCVSEIVCARQVDVLCVCFASECETRVPLCCEKPPHPTVSLSPPLNPAAPGHKHAPAPPPPRRSVSPPPGCGAGVYADGGYVVAWFWLCVCLLLKALCGRQAPSILVSLPRPKPLPFHPRPTPESRCVAPTPWQGRTGGHGGGGNGVRVACDNFRAYQPFLKRDCSAGRYRGRFLAFVFLLASFYVFSEHFTNDTPFKGAVRAYCMLYACWSIPAVQDLIWSIPQVQGLIRSINPAQLAVRGFIHAWLERYRGLGRSEEEEPLTSRASS